MDKPASGGKQLTTFEDLVFKVSLEQRANRLRHGLARSRIRNPRNVHRYLYGLQAATTRRWLSGGRRSSSAGILPVATIRSG